MLKGPFLAEIIEKTLTNLDELRPIVFDELRPIDFDELRPIDFDELRPIDF